MLNQIFYHFRFVQPFVQFFKSNLKVSYLGFFSLKIL